MFKLSFYVPDTHLDAVKLALFATGAGRYQQYQNVAWQVLGVGQFMPTAGSDPFKGDQDKLESVAEYRVEMLCDDALIEKAILALIDAHPYEAPAYEAWKIDYYGIN